MIRALSMATVVAVLLTALAGPAAARRHPPVRDAPEWSDEVRPLAHFVERNRGFDFDHRVEVTLLSEAAFRRRERRETEFFGVDPAFRQLLGRLSALGLASAEQPAEDVASEGGLLGYFDPFLGEVVIRGDDLDDPAVRTVLVHELAHALVAQRFTGRGLNSGSFAVTALSEGDATAVEGAYLDTLGPKERERVVEAFIGPSDEEVSALGVLIGAPYVLGPAYIEVIDLLGERNAAFRHPPRTDVEVIDPLREGLGTRKVELGRLPRLDGDEQRRGPKGELGQMLVFLTLAARLDVASSVEAAIGWGADRYVGFRRGKRDCLRFAIKGETIFDHEELVDAFDRWALAGPTGASTVEARDDDLLVTTCETDGPVESVTDLSEDVFLVLTGRLQWAARALRDQGATRRVARCVGDAMALDPQVLGAEREAASRGIRLRDLETSTRATLERRLIDVTLDCRVGLREAL